MHNGQLMTISQYCIQTAKLEEKKIYIYLQVPRRYIFQSLIILTRNFIHTEREKEENSLIHRVPFCNMISQQSLGQRKLEALNFMNFLRAFNMLFQLLKVLGQNNMDYPYLLKVPEKHSSI